MEWILNRTFANGNDGYQGYEFCGFLDGYSGDPSYLLESIFTLSISDVYYLRSVLSEKLQYYSEIESPSEKISNRITYLTHQLESYDGLVSVVEQQGLNDRGEE